MRLPGLRHLIAAATLAAAIPVSGCSSSGPTGCGSDNNGNSLGGSYCEDVDMQFTKVQVLQVSSALRIEYVRPVGDGEEKTLQIILDESQVQLQANTMIDLVATHAFVRRILAEATAPQDLTSELQSSSHLNLSAYGAKDGDRVTGTFGMLLKSGRALNGNFDAKLQNIVPPT